MIFFLSSYALNEGIEVLEHNYISGTHYFEMLVHPPLADGAVEVSASMRNNGSTIRFTVDIDGFPLPLTYSAERVAGGYDLKTGLGNKFGELRTGEHAGDFKLTFTTIPSGWPSWTTSLRLRIRLMYGGELCIEATSVGEPPVPSGTLSSFNDCFTQQELAEHIGGGPAAGQAISLTFRLLVREAACQELQRRRDESLLEIEEGISIEELERLCGENINSLGA